MPLPHTFFGAPLRRAVVALVTGLVTTSLSISLSAPAGATYQPEVGPAASSAASSAALVPLAIATQSASAEALEVEAEIRSERAGIICPVAGTIWFYDDFGNARSGGRSHQGNDLMSQSGVPVVAVVDGAVDYKSGSRQGKGAYLRGADGNEYWYFHLNSYVGEPRLVRQGEVIGIVGESGNAGGVHTHFEIHPGWDSYEVVNPYPNLDLVCTDRVPLR